MENFDSFLCPICYNQYTKDRVPRIIPCKNGHSVCSVCIEQILKAPGFMLKCPFDRDSIRLHNKTIEAFPKNLAFQELLSNFDEQELCETHKMNKLDLVCLECRTKICYVCEKQNHRGHKTEMISEISSKIKEKVSCYEKLTQLAEDHRKSWEHNLKEKEESLLKSSNKTFQLIVDQLTMKKISVDEKIKDHFKSLKEEIHSASSSWERKLLDINGGLQSQSVRGVLEEYEQNRQIPFDFILKEDLLSGAEDWEKLVNQECEVFKNSLERTFLEYDFSFARNLEVSEIVRLNTTKSEEDKDESEEPQRQSNGKTQWEQRRPHSNEASNEFSSQQEPHEIQNKTLSLTFQEKDQIYAQNKAIVEQIKRRLGNCELDVTLNKNNKIKLSTSAWSSCNDTFLQSMSINLRSIPQEYRDIIEMLEFSFQALSNKGIGDLCHIFALLPKLMDLNLVFPRTNEIDGFGLKSLQTSLPTLQQLTNAKFYFSQCGFINDKVLAHFGGSLSKIKAMKDLIIDISDCRKISNDGIKKLFENLSRMEGLISFSLLCKGCKKLENGLLEDFGAWGSEFANLKEAIFDFRGCPQLASQTEEDFYSNHPEFKEKLKLMLL